MDWSDLKFIKEISTPDVFWVSIRVFFPYSILILAVIFLILLFTYKKFFMKKSLTIKSYIVLTFTSLLILYFLHMLFLFIVSFGAAQLMKIG